MACCPGYFDVPVADAVDPHFDESTSSYGTKIPVGVYTDDVTPDVVLPLACVGGLSLSAPCCTTENKEESSYEADSSAHE